MSRINKLLIELPLLCEATNAKRESRLIELAIQDELYTTNSVFQQNDIDDEDPYNRLEPAFRWEPSYKDEGKKEYGYRLAMICYLSHEINEHGANEYYKEVLENMKAYVDNNKNNFPDIDNIMTIEQATLGWWED